MHLVAPLPPLLLPLRLVLGLDLVYHLNGHHTDLYLPFPRVFSFLLLVPWLSFEKHMEKEEDFVDLVTPLASATAPPPASAAPDVSKQIESFYNHKRLHDLADLCDMADHAVDISEIRANLRKELQLAKADHALLATPLKHFDKPCESMFPNRRCPGAKEIPCRICAVVKENPVYPVLCEVPLLRRLVLESLVKLSTAHISEMKHTWKAKEAAAATAFHFASSSSAWPAAAPSGTIPQVPSSSHMIQLQPMNNTTVSAQQSKSQSKKRPRTLHNNQQPMTKKQLVGEAVQPYGNLRTPHPIHPSAMVTIDLFEVDKQTWFRQSDIVHLLPAGASDLNQVLMLSKLSSADRCVISPQLSLLSLNGVKELLKSQPWGESLWNTLRTKTLLPRGFSAFRFVPPVSQKPSFFLS